ncbi:MAG: class I SAM-dependent methyltransferase [Vampirovibrionales bacterium]|nr:class I SAM-dependent methyltransferase [Vampirovibrionales bacterium]
MMPDISHAEAENGAKPALSQQEMAALAASLEKIGLSPKFGASPCSKETLSDCSKDCSEDCSEPGPGVDKTRPGFWQGLFTKGLYNTIDIAFDQVKKEPKTILMLGGCRQREFARHIALMLPASDITLVDPDEAEVQAAKEEICCRFKFVTAHPAALPFETGQFDLVIAHNLPEYAESSSAQARSAYAVYQELLRVSSRQQGNLMLSLPNRLALRLFGLLPGFKSGLKKTGICPFGGSGSSLNAAAIKRTLKTMPDATLGLEIHPLPWQWIVLNLNG